jgi:hypothetical protein
MRSIKSIGNKLRRGYIFTAFALIVGVVSPVLSVLVVGTDVNAQSAATGVQQVSTGYNTACALKNNHAYCWGSNQYGQLGSGTSVQSSTNPVAVATNKNVIPADPGVCVSKNWFGQCTQYSRSPAPEKPASALGELLVEKVSVGKTHACALADAKVFCWGDNSHGQLGNRTNTNSKTPVAVDVQFKDATPAPIVPSPCGGWFQPSCRPVPQPTKLKSALGAKEVIDISAGEYFTCALASDGSIACWGEGDLGRLGNNNTADYNYPQAVYKQAGVLDGKRGVRLAKASATSMCVLAVDTNTESDATGSPYCWGYGMGDGGIPGPSSSATACNRTSPRSAPTGASSTTYFSTSKPVVVSATQIFSDVNTEDYASGLGANNRMYYWGMNGYRQDISYSNVKTCVVNSCYGVVGTHIMLAGYSTSGTRTTHTGGSTNTNHYQGRATPGTHAGSAANTGGGGNSCTNSTHYGFTKNINYSRVGQRTPTLPAATALTGGSVGVMSGNVVNNLFCGTNTSGLFCDAHGAGSNEGQTGSAYTPHCVTTRSFFSSTTTCDPAPVGPQRVYPSGWLAGKSVESLDTGTSGYTCAVANGSLGCWGVNNVGQLGVGSTANRNVPTAVNL